MAFSTLTPASISDYRLLAQRRLPRQLFDYIDGGSYAEVTLAANRADLLALRLRQRVLRDVSRIDTGVTLLGQPLKLPVALAPIGLAGLMARRGEAQAARAAEHAGIPFCLSTVSICALEEVRQATQAPFWFQLYMLRDRGYVRELLQRAQAAGCGALVFTVDLAVLGARYRDTRNGMNGGLTLAGKLAKAWDTARRAGWLRDVALGGQPLVFGNLAAAVPSARSLVDFKQWVDAQFDASVTWRDLDFVRQHWNGPLILKGVLDAEDARTAADIGASALIVSNHGGRQLDSAPSSIAALPGIVEAVGDRLEILMDGGIRSGQDIAKALALGARAVLIGRPWIWALAARGEIGVTQIFDILARELQVTLALLGVARADRLDQSVLAE
ncbi:MAG: L-lactate dehydrogenase [Betaproteobacteria bacterium]|nr:L-lactate dehydrogenase [Betaproteobacteria bacterium]